MSLEDIQNDRLAKLKRLHELGIDPYPAESHRTLSIGDFRSSFTSYEQKPQTLAGRVMALRKHGGLMFADIFDGTGTIQLYMKEEDLGEQLSTFDQTVDIGDFVEATGVAALTKRGEQSLLVSEWRMLTKTLLPLPEKWHGLQDVEERYRKRYLDILFNPDLHELFVKKAKFWDVTRTFLKERGFLEVETPTLEVTTGGAEANPFKTHHKDFDLNVFLRISVGELWQKRLMAAGFPKTFEIGRVYRNEGSSPDHLQEFTNMEFYWAYANYEDGMALVEEMYKKIAQEVFGTTTFTTRGHTFDLGPTWQRIDYREQILKDTGVDVLEATDDELRDKLDELHVDYAGSNRERLTDTLWKYCRKQIAGPVFVTGHPKLVSPLSKARTTDPRTTERFQILIAGSEVGNGFSELNDPIDQRARFEEQKKLIEKGDAEAMMPEWEFVEMLEHGMPPTCGFGFGERLFAFMADLPVRDVQLFPLMRPR